MKNVPHTGLFWDKVNTDGECWLWIAARFGSGYGLFGYGKSKVGAHRYAYEQVIGPIPEGMFVCHVCDVKTCVRPAHLFLGTHADNMKDKQAKGRAPRGSMHPLSKLTEPDIHEIRRLYAAGEISYAAVARMYGVSKSLVFHIVHQHRWKHV